MCDTARHEAAHAVCSVRLGLPLAYTTLDPRSQPWVRPVDMLGGLLMLGETSLEAGTAAVWEAALPDAAARRNLLSLAVQQAAGIVAELDAEDVALTDIGHSTDLEGLVEIARAVGIPDDEQVLRAFVREAMMRAAAILEGDHGAGWNRVAAALRARRFLTGNEVRVLADA